MLSIKSENSTIPVHQAFGNYATQRSSEIRLPAKMVSSNAVRVERCLSLRPIKQCLQNLPPPPAIAALEFLRRRFARRGENATQKVWRSFAVLPQRAFRALRRTRRTNCRTEIHQRGVPTTRIARGKNGVEHRHNFLLRLLFHPKEKSLNDPHHMGIGKYRILVVRERQHCASSVWSDAWQFAQRFFHPWKCFPLRNERLRGLLQQQRTAIVP